ncbi:MAG: aminotransferase class IV [Caldilineaceae bacterium]|nr:aminotransferase class IV [Caldilineaceae bacterium]
MTSQRTVYVSGSFVPESEASFSIFDSALMYGDVIFETTRTFNGQPFRLREHIERLYVGLRTLEISCGLTAEEMEAATLETIERNRPCFADGRDFQIVHNVSRGPMGLYESVFAGGVKPTVTINCWPLTRHLAAFADAYVKGVHAVIPAQRSVPSRLIDPKIKNRSRIYYQMANLQAQKADPEAWALLTDEDGFLTEGTGSNFFVVKDGGLLTPEPRNILRGVTRQAVLELAESIGLACQQCNLEPYDVMTADEAFFTSTPFTIMPATRFNGHDVGSGEPGPVTRRLMSAWNQMVEVDMAAQARAFAEEVEDGGS